jgi:hypothetical protein
VFTFESSGVAISISWRLFSFLSCTTVSGRFASTVRSVIPGTFHIKVVPLTYMTLSGICRQYLSEPVTAYVYISASGCKQPPYCVYLCIQMVQVFIFTFMWPRIVTNFFIIKPTHALFSKFILAKKMNLYMIRAVPLLIIRSPLTAHLALVCHTGLKTASEQGHPGHARKLSANSASVGFIIKNCASAFIVDRGNKCSFFRKRPDLLLGPIQPLIQSVSVVSFPWYSSRDVKISHPI